MESLFIVRVDIKKSDLPHFYSYLTYKGKRNQQFLVIQCEVLLAPDEINDTYVDINNELQMNINIYNGLTILDFRI